ncbi:hypothetical protein MHY87_18285 [Microvirga sp. ACRRW]|uniref:hypothetical protein n=1 Tax=Microvirga sp. ACRRW TaxID=2918205 RepID=UPI001EF72A15|nr:hypothetical protein [Microvirga sp. ACRRW]MCG7394852.1 hypothetical protein [Microvirga sp. ACRRW]
MLPRTAIACACLVLSIGAARATGTLDCEAKDKAIDFTALSAVPYGHGSPFLNFQAELNLLLKGAPDDFRHLKLSQENLVHHWIDARDIKLLLYWERIEGPHAYVELVVETKRKPDDDTSRGTYQLSLFTVTSDNSRLIKKRGIVSCGVQ